MAYADDHDVDSKGPQFVIFYETDKEGRSRGTVYVNGQPAFEGFLADVHRWIEKTFYPKFPQTLKGKQIDLNLKDFNHDS